VDRVKYLVGNTSKSFDVVIVGQGLAGTTLAWALRQRGVHALVVDRGDEITSSRIAAGLITPVTGQRMAVSWRYAELFPFAETFYRCVEAEMGQEFFHRRSMIRLFQDEAESQAFANRANTLLQGLVRQPSILVDETSFHCEQGGFEMPCSARLDTRGYLEASRRLFESENLFRRGEVDPAADIQLHPGHVALPRIEVLAKQLVFCQGYEANALFPTMPFNPVKGEVLTLHVPGLEETRIVHRGVWLAPLKDGLFLCGSTYDRDRLDSSPTPEGRAQIEAKLRKLLRHSFQVVQHHAGIRPVVLDGRPILKVHPQWPRLAVFNGLGSKGALLAPFFASELADSLLSSLRNEISVSGN